MSTIIPRYAFWNPGTWSIPALYWDAFSDEQRIHAICKQLGKVIAYADYLGINVDDIAARLKAIEEGQLDPIIIEAIEEWFEDNHPEIESAIDALEAALPITAFDDVNTVEAALNALDSDISAVDAKFPVGTENIANAAITESKLSSALQNKFLSDNLNKMLIIGDSFASHSSNEQFTATWPDSLAASLHKTLTNLAAPGDGFVYQNGFLTQLNAALALPDKEKYGVIIVYGGVNDTIHNEPLTTFRSNAATIIDSLYDNFPNAKIYLCGINAGISNFTSTENQAELETYVEVLRGIPVNRERCAFVNTSKWLLCGEDMYSADNLHPHDTNGNRALAYSFINLIQGGEYPFFTIMDATDTSTEDPNALALQAILDKPYKVQNGIAYIPSSVKNVTLSSPVVTEAFKNMTGIPSQIIGARDCLTAYAFKLGSAPQTATPFLLSINNGNVVAAFPSEMLNSQYRIFVPAQQMQVCAV